MLLRFRRELRENPVFNNNTLGGLPQAVYEQSKRTEKLEVVASSELEDTVMITS